MPDYKKLRNTCDESAQLSEDLIDNFLMHYAAAKDNVAREFDERVAPYKHLTKKDTVWANMIKAQYIVHSIFKEDGLLRKYLRQPEIKARSKAEQEFLKDQIVIPWRFCFSRIIENPSPDFYLMEDVLSDTTFLLYSKSTTLTLTEQPAMLWFNLIAFNGECWVTYGPINAYQSFDADDIFFFATELNDEIDSDEDFMVDIEKNPVPYMMLLNGGRIPVTLINNDELLTIFSVEPMDAIDVESLRENFKVEYNQGVFRITAKIWDEPPHLAAAYYDENENQVLVSSMSDRGYAGLVETMNAHGFDISIQPHVRIHPAMFSTAELILQRDLTMNPYEGLFYQEPTDEVKAEVDRLNQFMESVTIAVNAGDEIDIEALALNFGLDKGLAKSLVENMVGKVGPPKKRK